MRCEAKCPAANTERNIHGLKIARCGISGMVQAAEGSPCCDQYTECSIWRQEKERLWINKKSSRAETNVRADGSLGWEKV